MPRGRYKIFLGMAAGVGKTYRMLQEGRTEAEAGRDVVIGYLETHGRSETAALAEGFEVVPRRRVSYRDMVLEEMDLPAVLERAPELALIDELAVLEEAGLRHAGGDATFFLWLDAGETSGTPTADALAERLLERGIVLAPGSFFGAASAGFLRLALVPTLEECRRAADLLAELLPAAR